MEVKGTAVKSIPEFVKKQYPDQFEAWINALPEKSKKIMTSPILPSTWYPVNEALIEPTRKICDLFYGGKEKGAWQAGRISADIALTGVYKVFIKVGTPHFLIKRASNIFSTYYRPSKLNILESAPNKVGLQILEFPGSNILVENRIAGWVERALEISGCKNVKTVINQSIAKGDKVTEIMYEWK